MLLVVSTVGFMVHVYSIGYMKGDGGYYRFFAYLNLFMFSMFMLILGNNFLMLYVFWEAVGLCSYLLISFWYTKQSAANAGTKAFLVNRVGDFGFGLGIMLIFVTMGTLSYSGVFSVPGVDRQRHHDRHLPAPVHGAMGKSAQFPLHVWLPDAMEGPTPVSSLIHAATMVNRRRLHGGPLQPDLLPLAERHVRGGAGRALSRRSSPPPSAWCRTTSSGCSPIPRSASSATCS